MIRAIRKSTSRNILMQSEEIILGVSDGKHTERTLQKLFNGSYTNYHYHLDPALDITQVPKFLLGIASLISCSEVLEHVQPPIESAFAGIYSLLRPVGILVISVPHTSAGNIHQEHFPVMNSSELKLTPVPKLTGVDLKGQALEFTNLVFHGGIGATLEYRVFSQDSLIKNLEAVGFNEIQSIQNSFFYGISWEPWSGVWIAKKPKE